jgi:hypothetical protein
MSFAFARDRALIVSAAELAVEPGWRDGWAAAPAGDIYAVLEIDGAGLRHSSPEAASADLDAGSPSAAIMFAGIPACFTGPGRRPRGCMSGGFRDYVWHWLERRGDAPNAHSASGGYRRSTRVP